MSRALVLLAGVLGASGASAQNATTVQSLLDQEFQVVGTYTSTAGAALFLQKKDKLFFCVVAETSKSADVATRYCKPVR